MTDFGQRSVFSVALIVLGEIKNDFRVIKTAESLEELGLEVQIFGVSEDPGLTKPRKAKIGNIKTTLIPDISLLLPEGGEIYDIWRYKKQALLTNLWPAISQFGPDIIHTNDFDTLAIGKEITQRMRDAGRRIKWVHDIHNYVRGISFEDHQIRKECVNEEEDYISLPDLLLTVSEKISLKMMSDHNLSDPPSVILNSPLRKNIDPSESTIRESLGINKKKKLIVYSGDIKHDTGIIDVVEAISEIGDGVHLAIISDCESRFIDEIESFAKECGCRDRVHKMPFVEPENVPNFIRDADLGVYPQKKSINSDYSIPKKVLEYVFAGLPVVSSDCSSVSEFISMWKIGEVFESDNNQRMTQQLKKVIASPKSYTKKITEELLHLYSWEHNKEMVEEAYLSLIGSISRNSGKKKIFGEISGVEGGLLTGWIAGLGHGYSKCMLEISSDGERVSSVNLDARGALSKITKTSDKVKWSSILPNSHYDGSKRDYRAIIKPWNIECESLTEGFSLGIKKPVTGKFLGAKGHTLAGEVTVSNKLIKFIEVDVFYNETYVCSKRVKPISKGMETWSRDFMIPLPAAFDDDKLRRFRMKFSEWGEEFDNSPKLVKFPIRSTIDSTSINKIQIENLINGGGEWGVPRGVENHGNFGLKLEEYCFSPGDHVKVYGSEISNVILDISLFRIGHYGGKKCRMIRSWNGINSSEKNFLDFEIDNDFLPGTYHLVAKEEFGKRQFIPFCVYSQSMKSRILVVHPNIPNHLFKEGREYDFQRIAYFEGFENTEDSLTNFQVTNDVGGSSAGNYPIWVLNSIHWLEKKGMDYFSVSDDELHFNPSLAMDKEVIVFLGNSRFWTEEMHRVVGHHLSMGKKIAILGAGMGEQIIDLDKNRNATLSFSGHEYRSGVPLTENWIEVNSPVEFQGFAKLPIEAKAETKEANDTHSVLIRGSWDSIKFSKSVEKNTIINFTGSHELAGNISIETSIINFQNKSQIFHGGFESWSNLLEIEWASQLLKSFLSPDIEQEIDENLLRSEAARKIAEEKWGAIPTGGFEKNKKPVRRVCILTALWMREELSRLVLTHYLEMAERMREKFDIEIIAVGSKSDSEKMANELGINYVNHQNLPLSEKWSKGMLRCADFDPDVVMTIGSDDLISDATLESLCQKISEGRMAVGIRDMYIIDSKNKTLNYWSGYTEGRDRETIGMARCYSREILDKIGFDLWNGQQINKGLDNLATSTLARFGNFPIYPGEELSAVVDGFPLKFGHVGYTLEDISGFAVDIKTEENISKIRDYGVMSSSSVESSINLLRSNLGESTTENLISFLGEK